MTITATICKGPIELGAGTITAGSASVTSYTATNSRALNSGRNVQVLITGGVSSNGTFNTRVVTDGGATITLADKCPFT